MESHVTGVQSLALNHTRNSQEKSDLTVDLHKREIMAIQRATLSHVSKAKLGT